MVLQSSGGSGEELSREWHRKRWEAESETFGILEWGEIEIQRFDLDEIQFSRKYKQSTYHSESQIEGEGGPKSGKDVRETFPERD